MPIVRSGPEAESRAQVHRRRLTTFSTFSAEVTDLLMGHRLGWALITTATHVLGSILMTVLGIATVELIRRS